MRIGVGAVVGFLYREIADLLRQRTLVLLTVLGPFLILFAFGAGYRDEKFVLRTLFVGPAGPEYPRLLDQYADRFDEFIAYRGYTSDVFGARQELEDGGVDAIVVFPTDPMDDLLAGRRAEATVIHDELNPIQQVAVGFAVRIATDEVNQAIVEQILVTAQQESRPYRESVVALSEQRAQLGSPGPEQRQTLAAMRATVSGLLAQSAALDRFAELYGGGQGQPDVAAFRQQLEATSAALGSGGDSGTLTEEQLTQLDAELRSLEESARVVDQVDPAVLARPFTSGTETLSAINIDETDFFGAAATALLLQHLALSLGALTFVRDRAMGLFELVRVGPVGPGEALVGKLLAFLAVGAVSAAVLVAALHYLLDVPLQGEVAWLAVVLGLLLLASIALGFTLSLLSRTDTQAVQYAMLVLLASLFFSGFFLDHERFKPVVATVARALPVTSAITGVQDVMLRGLAPDPVDLAVLGGLAAFGFIASWLLLRRELRTT